MSTTATPRFGGKRAGATCKCGWTGPHNAHPPALCRTEKRAYARMIGTPPEIDGARHGNTRRDYVHGFGDGRGEESRMPFAGRAATYRCED